MKVDLYGKELNQVGWEQEQVGDEWWSHYCKKQDDVMSFQKGVECDWCGTKEEWEKKETT